MKIYLRQILSGQRPFIDIWHYLVGHYRYTLYYSKFKFLIRKHIREQIEFRINNMNRKCFNRGECIKCGCLTTALQMCNKSCDGKCYPVMYSKKVWKQIPPSFKKLKKVV